MTDINTGNLCSNLMISTNISKDSRAYKLTHSLPWCIDYVQFLILQSKIIAVIVFVCVCFCGGGGGVLEFL